jgi:Domain of unknown function (DUF4936)
MTRSYYIYYRTNESEPQVRAAVGAMLTALARDTGVQGRLLHRCDDMTTWMEVYEGIRDPARFERALDAAVDTFGLRALLAPNAERHIERFVDDGISD